MWRHVAQSLQGPSHAAAGTVCQDSHLVHVLGEAAAQTMIACSADGAGSAKHSDIGSKLVCEVIVDKATQHYESHGNFNQLQRADIIAWCEGARERFRTVADDQDCEMRDLATTLCVAILTPEGSFFFQIGDGAITVGRQGVYGVVFWPQSGEYANVTNFLTSDRFQDKVEFEATSSCFTDVALFTDGIERLALNFENQIPHLPFFMPLFHAVRATVKGGDLDADLKQLLQSDSVNNRSDDDKTLILATQLSEATDGAD